MANNDLRRILMLDHGVNQWFVHDDKIVASDFVVVFFVKFFSSYKKTELVFPVACHGNKSYGGLPRGRKRSSSPWVSAEYLAQNMDFDFDSGTTTASGAAGSAIFTGSGSNNFGTVTFTGLANSGNYINVAVPANGDIDNCFTQVPIFSVATAGTVTMNAGSGILKSGLGVGTVCRLDVRATAGQNTSQDKIVQVSVVSG